MNRMASWVIIGTMALPACGPSAADNETAIAMTQTAAVTAMPAPTPDLPQSFLDSVDAFIAEGERLIVMISLGVNYVNFNDQLTILKTSYHLAKADWPNSFPLTFTNGFDKAIEGWDWASYMWGLKINKSEAPVEPDINGYVVITTYGGDRLIYDIHPNDYIVDEYRRRKFLPLDVNIRVLRALAVNCFEASRNKLQAALP
jgi:hypothetical protein